MNAPTSYSTSVGGATCSIDTSTSAPCAALAKGKTRSIHLAHGEMANVYVTKGMAWITMEGDRHDYVLETNEHLRFHGPGQLVMEAIEGDVEVTFRTSAVDS